MLAEATKEIKTANDLMNLTQANRKGFKFKMQQHLGQSLIKKINKIAENQVIKGFEENCEVCERIDSDSEPEDGADNN